MQTLIDFGKEFINTVFRQRDTEKALTFLADDIVWITPEEVLHLKTRGDIRDFLEKQKESSSQPCNVDVASIRQAAAPGNTNTIVYEVNLIPRKEQDTVSLRISLTVCRMENAEEIVFVGMSRRYERSDGEQMRGFMENLPAGIMVLAGFGQNNIRLLYLNSFFSSRLGYNEEDFFDRADVNPFFMIPYKEQKRMMALVNELSLLQNPGIVSMQVSMEKYSGEGTSDHKTIPFQMTARAAYKDRDGSRTILYLLFSDMSDVVSDLERQKRKELESARKALEEETEKNRDTVLADAVRLRDEAQAMQDQAADQLEAMDRVVREAKEAADNARKEADEQVRKAKEESEARAGEEISKARAEADRENASIKEEADRKVQEAGDLLHSVQEEFRNAKKQSQDRILQLEWEVREAQRAADEKISKREEELSADADARVKEAQDAAQKKEKELNDRIESIQAEAEGNRQGYLTQIGRLQDTIEQRDLGIRKQDLDAKVAAKEKDKSMKRLSWLLSGQMAAIESLAQAAEQENSLAKQEKILDQVKKLAADVPEMSQDLKKMAEIDPSGRKGEDIPFALSQCLNTVRKVIRPQCRKKGVIFSCETDGSVPDQVIGSKYGLQLSFLGILENAVEKTDSGGKILLRATADPPVRDRAYFHFVITDTGSGISDRDLPTLFDNPEGELSIARKVISGMGGSIQVRSSEGKGSSFEISVSMQLQETGEQ